MPIENHILRWIFYCLLAYGYGALVQYILGYDKDRIVQTMSIGAVGMLLGKYVLYFLNLNDVFHVGGIPLISSLIGSFIIPGIMWFLRKDSPLFPANKHQKRD